jgi:riboflavin-specific deaminase-like protein
MDPVEFLVSRSSSAAPPDRPWVTLSYAQSLDGSLAAAPARRLALSGPEAEALTHRLRSLHDGLLVGIGTILSDDPRLTVRLAAGPSPRPIVLDSRLRIPASARIWEHPAVPWIATTDRAPAARAREIEQSSGQVLVCPAEARGRVDLAFLLSDLHRRGVRRVMVEGGPTVLSSFLAEQLADALVLTLAPRLLAGIRLATAGGPSDFDLPLRSTDCRRYGEDIVVWGEPTWPANPTA